jgi:hypothetical protein
MKNRIFKNGSYAEPVHSARWHIRNADDRRLGEVFGGKGRYQAQRMDGTMVGKATSLEKAAMLFDQSGGMLSCHEAINKLAEAAGEFLEFDEVMADLGGKMTPEVGSEIVESYGVGFRNVQHVYQDMLNRARAAD